MERTRSKRGYYYSDHDPSPSPARTKPRYTNQHTYSTTSNRTRAHPPSRGPKPTSTAPDHSPATTAYRILCHDAKVGGVIGKGGGIIKQIRQQTGAWVNVHELVAGDEERIIEISDARRKDPDGRVPAYSPAESGLLLVHDRILTSEPLGVDGVEDGEYGRNGGLSNRVATRIVVSRMHVGCLLGKGGKIIEQMRVETKTQIRVLPRDHTLPRCISASEEIVQIVGEVNNVKSAVEIIASRLKESQHRDRSNFRNRSHSPESSFPDEDYVPRRATEAVGFESRLSSAPYRDNGFAWRQTGVNESIELSDGVFYGKDLVLRVLCPVERVHRVIGEEDGILELLRNEIGVELKLGEELPESNEQIIIVSSEESPDDEMFPAQEALLHIQAQIADLSLDQDNIVRTRLLITSGETRCLQEFEVLLEIERATGAKLHLIQFEKVTDELLQIEGVIISVREALIEVTSRLRDFQFSESCGAEDNLVPFPTEADPARNLDAMNRITVPLVTRNILEVVIPEHAAPKLITKSRNKLTQISEFSGAIVTLVEERAGSDKVIQISGTPEQAERAQSLLQGFILSTLEDGA